MPETSKIGAAFDNFTRNRLASPTLEAIWQQAYGANYAAKARPNAFYPQSVLEAIVNATNKIARGNQIVEIGCGHGLAGRYLAQILQFSHYCGIDISPGSIELARALAKNDGAAQSIKASFWVADAASIPLEDGSCNIAVCLDVLLYLCDKPASMHEVARILTPGGLFAFTTWEQGGGHNARIGAGQVTDYRKLLTGAGLNVLAYEEVDGWRDVQSRVFQGIINAESKLKEEIGGEMAAMWVNMAEGGQRDMASRRYVFGLAQRTD